MQRIGTLVQYGGYVLLLLVMLSLESKAQVHPIMQDTTSIEPNSIRVVATVTDIDHGKICLKVERVVTSGRAVTHTIGAGDNLVATHAINDKLKRKTITVDLLERMNLDGGQPTYEVTRFRLGKN